MIQDMEYERVLSFTPIALLLLRRISNCIGGHIARSVTGHDMFEEHQKTIMKTGGVGQ